MLIFVIPAYNEEENIGLLLKRIQTLGYEPKEYRVIVVDDGSRDSTVSIAGSFEGQMPVSVVSHPVNRGAGAAFNTGFIAALKIAQPNDKIATLEADNTSDLAILPEMIHRIDSGFDLALASCYMQGGRVEGTNIWRKFLSSVANSMLAIVFSVGVKTFSSFYRVYRADALQRAFEVYDGQFIEQPGFVCMVEVLIKMKRLGLRISEVPMVLRMGMRKGKSKMHILRTIRDYGAFLLTDMRERRNQAK